MNQDTGLKAKDLTILREIFESYPDIEKVKIYGSRAMGTFKNTSDLDLVLIGKNIKERTLKRVILDLMESSISYQADVQIYEQLSNSSLIEHIHKFGITIYENKSL